MVMVADLVPALKQFLRPLGLRDAALQMVMRVMIAFMMHYGRMSCLQAAGTLRSETRHRAQVFQFLARPRWRACDINGQLREAVLQLEATAGPSLFIVDATLS